MFKDGTFQLKERMLLDSGDVRYTKDGYMVARPRIARTGIQTYAGYEMGVDDMKLVRVLRPEGEVFDKDAMASLAHRPVTNDHPSEAVTADNWRKYSVGNIGDEIARDGEFIRVPLTLMDTGVIKEFRDGKAELSVGYSADIKWQPGKLEDGTEYDAVQTNIRANHVAVVDRARGGPLLRIGDQDQRHEQGVTSMPKYMIDGIEVEMSETANQVVSKTLRAANDATAAAQAAAKSQSDQLTAQVTTLTTAKDTAEKSVSELTAKVATLEKQLGDAAIKPEVLDGMVQARQATIAKAKSILGDKLVVDGKTDADIRKQVVSAKLGDLAKDWSDDQNKVAFDTLTAGVKIDAAAPGTVATGSLQDAARVIAGAVGASGANANDSDAAKARLEYNDRIQNQWKNPGKIATA